MFWLHFIATIDRCRKVSQVVNMVNSLNEFIMIYMYKPISPTNERVKICWCNIRTKCIYMFLFSCSGHVLDFNVHVFELSNGSRFWCFWRYTYMYIYTHTHLMIYTRIVSLLPLLTLCLNGYSLLGSSNGVRNLYLIQLFCPSQTYV